MLVRVWRWPCLAVAFGVGPSRRFRLSVLLVGVWRWLWPLAFRIGFGRSARAVVSYRFFFVRRRGLVAPCRNWEFRVVNNPFMNTAPRLPVAKSVRYTRKGPNRPPLVVRSALKAGLVMPSWGQRAFTRYVQCVPATWAIWAVIRGHYRPTPIAAFRQTHPVYRPLCTYGGYNAEILRRGRTRSRFRAGAKVAPLRGRDGRLRVVSARPPSRPFWS